MLQALTTIAALRELFTRYGVPDQLVSDYGMQFTSLEFETFLKGNGIRHITSSPFHPATNGLAERFIQTFKQALKSAKATKMIINKHLNTFLLGYRNASQSTISATPATTWKTT